MLLVVSFIAFSDDVSNEQIDKEFSHVLTEGNGYVDADKVYKQMKLKDVIDYETFKLAIQGYNKIDGKTKEMITIVDFKKPSTEERFYVIDLKKNVLLYKSHVAHGRKSGENMATEFSNKPNSNKSSLGFYLTEGTYNGGNGYSMILEGLEKGINDRAKERYIVMHGADYANPKLIPSLGRLGRSYGCPSLPHSINREVIDTIKEGSILFIHGNDEDYIQSSDLVG